MGSRLQKNSENTRKRIEAHTFDGEDGDEYEGSKFGGFADYFRRKKIKLQNLDVELRASSAGAPQIFKGIVANVNGYTQPSLNDIHRMIVAHGGGFLQYLDGKTNVTHIIASALTPKKAIEFRRYRIVKPAWVVDSVNAGRVLPWESYKVIDEGVNQRVLSFADGKIGTQASTQVRSYREQTGNSWYTSQVRRLAEEIDEDDVAKHPAKPDSGGSSTPQTQRSPPVFVKDEVPAEDIDDIDMQDPAPPVSDSESYEVSSSFEEVFNAAKSQPSQESRNQGPATAGMPVTPPLDHVGDMSHGEVLELLDSRVSPQSGEEHPSDTGSFKLASPVHTEETRSGVGSSKPAEGERQLTAEEHNVILLSDPHIRKSSTANPDFLKQYYSESRLHHLSTWKADLKAQMQKLASDKTASQKLVPKRKPGARRYIMHVDFDSFFCAVSLKAAPEYADKPAVVAHGQGTGSEIASCNYPARAYGIKNGMWMKKALELCSNIKVLPYDFPAYEEASRSFYTAILDVGGIVQSVSVDEALVDISALCIPVGGSDGRGISEGSIWREQEKANEIAQALRVRIKELTGCNVSIGIGGNILLAKVALRKAKPAGQYLLKPEEVLDFIGELLVTDLPGIAYSIGSKLEEIGVKYVKDIRSLSKERLTTILGPKTGEKVWEYSRGIDKTEVGEQVVRKSVSAEVNWGIRFTSQPEAEEFMHKLSAELHQRLVDQGVRGSLLTIKIMRRAVDAGFDPPKFLGHGKCDTFNKSVSLGVATNSAEVIGREAVSVLRSFGFSPGELRGIGIQMTKLEALKGAGDGRADASQKTINFNSVVRTKPIKNEMEDIDDPDSPTKPRTPAPHPATFIARINEADTSTKKPLNLTGTQFILPTHVDPKVLAELPLDIRSKLMAQGKSASVSREQSPSVRSRSQSPIKQLVDPTASQLDLEVLKSLPEDIRAEILRTYAKTSTTPRAQGLLPQSPRKNRIIPPNKKTTPTKKRTGLLFRGLKNSSISTLTQSNFVVGASTTVSGYKPDHDGTDSDSHAEPETDTFDPAFLAALPEDVRAEVLADHRRQRLAKRSLAAPSRKARPEPKSLPGGQRRIRLPPKPKKPTFTTAELTTLPQLRVTLSAWHQEFLSEGPHPDDVAAMERYLRRVVLEERDMAKAEGVVKWLAWLVDASEEEEEAKTGLGPWRSAVEDVKGKIQDAVRTRGLGPLDLG
jgi:DNA repair protein REV1